MIPFAQAICLHVAGQVPEIGFDPLGVTGNLFVSTLPSGPDEALMAQPYGGISDQTLQPTAYPLMQFRARGGMDPRWPVDRLGDIYAVLAGLDSTDLPDGDGGQVHVVTCDPVQDSPFPLGQDDLGRHEFSQNYQCRIHHPTIHRPAVTA